MWQVHHQKVDLLFDTANHGECLAKIRLSMARRMRQWHEHLPLTLLGREDIVLHNPDRVKTLGGGDGGLGHHDLPRSHVVRRFGAGSPAEEAPGLRGSMWGA